jgi:quercetin dioxygenase-like cupin family protein
MLQLNQQHSVVPLLCPAQHQLPFAAALHIHHLNEQKHQQQHDAAAGVSHAMPVLSDAAHQQLPRQQHNDSSSSSCSSSNESPLVELFYVLSGSGHFTSSSGAVQRVSAGDSIIALQHEAQFAAGLPPAAATPALAGQQEVLAGSRVAAPRWLNMVPWLKQAFHTKQQQQQQQPLHGLEDQQQQQQQQPDQLVLLQLLLPSELLTGELASCHAGHAHAVAQQVPWSTSGQSTGSNIGPAAAPAGSTQIDQECVCRWLVGAQQAIQPQQTSQQEQQQHPVPGPAVASAEPASDISHSAGDDSSANPSSSSSSSSSVDTATLPALTTHQVLKRALSEVGAFQLPAQTNRLALLFGPHASPAVCLSFGVEVFEPGHVTQLHTHSTAHELFFVLAGSAVAVHGGPGGRQQQQQQQQRREVMGVGDVAVFPPGVLHGVDNESDQQLYCLQVRI